MKGFLLIDGQVEADFTPEKFFHLHDIDMSGAIDKQVRKVPDLKNIANLRIQS